MGMIEIINVPQYPQLKGYQAHFNWLGDDDDEAGQNVLKSTKSSLLVMLRIAAVIYRSLVPNRLLVCKVMNKSSSTKKPGWRHPYSNRLLARRGTCSFYFEFAANGSASLIGSKGQKTRRNFNLFLDPVVETSVINFYFSNCWDLVQNYQMVQFFSHHRKSVKYLDLDLSDWILNWASDKCVSVQNILRIFSPNVKALTIKKCPYYWDDGYTILMFTKDGKKDKPTLKLPPAAKLEKLKFLQLPLKMVQSYNYILREIVKTGVNKLKELNLVYGEKEKQKYLQNLQYSIIQPGRDDKTMLTASVTQARMMKDLKFDPQEDLLTLSFISLCEPHLRLIQVNLVEVSSDIRLSQTVETILPSILGSSSESLEKAIFSISHLQFPRLLKDLPNFPQLKHLELDFFGPFPNKAASATEAKIVFIKFSDTRFPSLHHLTLSNCPPLPTPPPEVGKIPVAASNVPCFEGQCSSVKFLGLKSSWLVHKEWLEKLSKILPQIQDLWITESDANSEDFSSLQEILKFCTKLQRLQLKLIIGPSASPYAALKAATFIGTILHSNFKSDLDLCANESEQTQEFQAEFYPMQGLDMDKVSDLDIEKRLSDWLYSPRSLPVSFLSKPELPFKIPVTIYADGIGAMEKVADILDKSCMWKKEPKDARRNPKSCDYSEPVEKPDPTKISTFSTGDGLKIQLKCPDPPSITSKEDANEAVREIRNSTSEDTQKGCTYFII